MAARTYDLTSHYGDHLAENARFLYDSGVSVQMLPARLGCSAAKLEQTLRRHGDVELAKLLWSAVKAETA